MPSLTCLIATLTMLLLAGPRTGFAQLDRTEPTEPTEPALAPSPGEPSPPAWPDSLEEFDPEAFAADWDSVTAAFDASVRRQGVRQVLPRFGLRVNKAEGLHLDLGGSLRDRRFRLAPLELGLGYDFARERPNASGSVRFDLRRERWLLEIGAHDDARPIGQHRPYGNTWFALLGGYDAMQYLRERELCVLLSLRASEERQAWLGWTRAQQGPLRAVTDVRLFGSDKWMKVNEPADRVLANGIRLRARRAPAYAGETATRGLVAEATATAYGGKLLGGSHEFSHAHADLWYARPINRGDFVHLRFSGTLAAGRPPRQAWPDLGGDAGLRAYPPRGFGTADTLVGHARLLARVELRSRAAQLKRSRVPLLRRLGFRIVPFIEAGSVWGRDPGGDALRVRPIREWKDLKLPRRSDVRWDLGFGLRQEVNYPGILSYAQVDFAWPMGADTGPARVTVQLSKDGLD